MINADKLGKLDARYRPGARRDNEFAAEEARLLDELLAAADLSSPTTSDVRSDGQAREAQTAAGDVTRQAPVPPTDQPPEQAVVMWPSQYDAETSSAPTAAGTTTTIDAGPGRPGELRQAWTLGATGLGDTQGSPQDLAASVDLGAPSSPDARVSDQTGVADSPHFRVAWQVPAPAGEPPEEQAVVWPSQYDAETSSAPTAAGTTTTIDVDQAAENDRPRQAWSLDADLSRDEPTPVEVLTGSDGVSSAAAPAPVAGDEDSETHGPQVATTWQAAAPEAPQDHAVPVWPAAYGTTTPAPTAVADATTLENEEPGPVDQPPQAWSLDAAEPSVVEPEIVAALAAFVDLSVPTTPELPADDESADDESPQFAVTPQVTVAVPDQEDEHTGPAPQAVTVWPAAYVAETATSALAAATAATDADEPVQFEKVHQAESSQDTGPAGGEPPAGVPAPSADLVAPGAVQASSPESTNDAGTPPAEMTSQEAEASPEQPEEQAVTASPAAYSSQMAVTPAVSDSTTPVADKPREFEPRYRPWTLRSARVAEEPKPLDEPATSADLASPVTPEVSFPETTNDAGTPPAEVTSQKAEASPEQPAEKVTAAPAAYSSQMAVTPAVSETTTPVADKPREFEPRYRPWTLRSARAVAEEPKPLDEPAASADLASPVSPEVSSPESTNDAGTPPAEVTSQEAEASPEQPAEKVTTAPAAYSSQMAVTPAVSDLTTPVADKPREFETRYRPWTLRSAKAAVEEPKLFDEPTASDDVASLVAPEVPSPIETRGAETSQAEGTSQAPVAAPEEPEQQEASAWPSPPRTSAGPTVPAPTTSDVPHDLDGRYRAWALRAAKLADEELQPVDKPVSSADVASPEEPEVQSPIEPNEADTAQPEGTSQAPVAAAQPPAKPPATSWPSAFATRTSASPTVPVAETSAQEPHDLDARYRAWILRAAAQPKSMDKPAASSDLPSPAAPGVPTQVETNGAETSQLEVTSQAPVAAPEQPHERATEVTPAASTAVKPVGPSFAGTTVNRANKPGKPEAPIRAWNFRDIASAVEEPSATHEQHDSADPDVVVMAGDDTSDTDAFRHEVTSHAAPSAPEQSHEDRAASPSAESAPEPANGTAPQTATSIVHKPGKLDARYRPWTMSAGELATKEEEARSELAADGHLSPSAETELRSAEQVSPTATTASPSPYNVPRSQGSALSSTTTVSVGTKPRRVRVSPGAIAILALVFLLAALGTGFVALNQKSTTGQWHSRYQSQVVVNRALSARNDALSKDLVSARGAITFLNSNTSALNRQIKSLQTQLSSASSAQQKAFAKSPLFGQISSEAVTAANEASVCAGEMGSLQTEINDDLANPTHKDPLLQGNTHNANLVCTVARQDNQQLQATLRSVR
jgi:hypothetical protein